MKKKNSKIDLDGSNEEDTPWYGRLILGIAILLFTIFILFLYFSFEGLLTELIPFATDVMLKFY